MIIQTLCWPLADLGQAFAALTNHPSRLSPPATASAVDDWMTWAALRCQIDAFPIHLPLRELHSFVLNSSPAIYEIDGKYLVVRRAGKHLRILAPDLVEHSVPTQVVIDALRAPFDTPHRARYETLVASLPVSPSRQRRLLGSLLEEQTETRRFTRGWRLHSDREETQRIRRDIPTLVASHMAQYLLWLSSWALLGAMSFSGHLDRAWIEAWALFLFTLIPFRALTTWTQGTFAIALGRLLKRRLLQGALKLAPDEVRTGGVASFLGQALEAEAIELLAISGGIGGLLALLELGPALFVLGRFAVALLLWCLLTLFAGWRFFHTYQRWTAQRMKLTNHLVESMVGHRTRLAQQKRAGWHADEDSLLAQYLQVSENVDHTGSWLIAAIPRGWLLTGLACLVPSIAAGHTLSAETAIVLGGILLAYSAFHRLVASLADIAGAIVGWQRVKPLFLASTRRETPGELPPGPLAAGVGQPILEADRLQFRYPNKAAPALQACSLTICQGERILLEGPSGGGKTTLASLLTGLRQPDSGLLLIRGFDRHTLTSSAWRRQVAAAPQFHENHVMTETLAFNLLMGRTWPPTSRDIEEAEEVCHDLGLGELVAAMPSGLMQMVGEGGWQLSHGERSRVFLARALLQRSSLVILDESFAALDPENLQLALESTMRRADTLVVIAHP